jgi:hypothetical protein
MVLCVGVAASQCRAAAACKQQHDKPEVIVSTFWGSHTRQHPPLLPQRACSTLVTLQARKQVSRLKLHSEMVRHTRWGQWAAKQT